MNEWTSANDKSVSCIVDNDIDPCPDENGGNEFVNMLAECFMLGGSVVGNRGRPTAKNGNGLGNAGISVLKGSGIFAPLYGKVELSVLQE